MATTNTKKGWRKLCEIRMGPGRKKLKKALDWAIDFSFSTKSEDFQPKIFNFGTTPRGYRMFPIRIQGIELDGRLLNIVGVLDYRNHPDVPGTRLLDGKNVRIIGYCPRRRAALLAQIFD